MTALVLPTPAPIPAPTPAPIPAPVAASASAPVAVPAPAAAWLPAPADAGGIAIANFGCRLNLVEGETLAAAARGLNARPGDASGPGGPGVLVVNSCIVTARAERDARRVIARAHAADPARRIVVTGCGVGADPDRWRALAGVDAVLPNAAKQDPVAIRAAIAGHQAPLARPAQDAVAAAPLPFAPQLSGPAHARAFVAVQTGCDHRCTFCIIPAGRGRARSADPDAVVALIRRAVAGGRLEAVLTGVDLTSYGQDLGARPTLGDLCVAILRGVPGLPRLRLSSLDAIEIDATVMALIADEPRMMPHLHLSLQSGDAMILKRMRRRHAPHEAVALAATLRARRPGLTIGADLIAGFPTETDAMFAATLAHVDDVGLTFGHVFPYSARSGTPAARMPQLPRQVVADRAAALRAVIARATTAHLDARTGTCARVLVERGGLTGHAEDFTMVALDRPAHPGDIIDVALTGHDGRRMTATPARRLRAVAA